MREEDLIPCFLDTLAEFDPDKVKAIRDNPENAPIWQWLDNLDEEEMPELAVWLLDELFGDLDTHAPPYFYFGAHPGDGSDYGFWLSEEVNQQVQDNGGLVVSDLEEVPSDFSGEVLHVNDHGNATLYCRPEGSEVWSEVWSVV